MATALILANVADSYRDKNQNGTGWAIAAYGVLVVGQFGLLIPLGLLLQLIVAIVPAEQLQATGLEFQIDSLPLLALGLWLPSTIGLALLLPPVRGLMSRVAPIARDRTVHAIALASSTVIVTQLLALLGVGIGTLVEFGGAGEPASGVSIAVALWVQDLIWVAIALAGVGFLVRRNFANTLRRLAVVVPSRLQIASGVGAGFGLVVIVTGVVALISLVGLGVDEEVGRLGEQTFGPLLSSPIGFLTVGIAAPVAEEMLFRGALQPRFGLVLTAVLFTLLHASNGLTLSTWVVLVVAVGLGLLRARTNTSTTMITHGTYNSLLVTISLFVPGF